MVKTVEEITREQDIVLRRKAEKLLNGLKVQTNYFLTKRVSASTTEWSVQCKYSVLVYQQIQERLCRLKKDKITLCNGWFCCASM